MCVFWGGGGAGSYSTDLEMSLVFIYRSFYKGFCKTSPQPAQPWPVNHSIHKDHSPNTTWFGEEAS